MGGKTTIKDIARIANVSVTTVSRYINGKYDHMSEETKSHIQSVIERVGFQPNTLARGLRMKNSRYIGIITSNFRDMSTKDFISGVSDVLFNSNYIPMFFDSGDDLDKERVCIQSCVEQTMGIIFRPISKDFRAYNYALMNGLPTVLFDRFWPTWQYDAVYTDSAKCIRTLFDHLIEQGYKDIYFIKTPSISAGTKLQREAEYKLCMMETYGAEFYKENFIVECQQTRSAEEYEAAFRDILSKKTHFGPKAVIVDTQLFMQHFHTVHKNIGFRCPEDLAICGFDCNHWAEIVTPSITNIYLPHDLIASEAAKLLIRRIESVRENTFDPSKFKVEQLQIKPTFTIAESTRKVIV